MQEISKRQTSWADGHYALAYNLLFYLPFDHTILQKKALNTSSYLALILIFGSFNFSNMRISETLSFNLIIYDTFNSIIKWGILIIGSLNFSFLPISSYMKIEKK
jgi:hypothetical protein